MRSLLIATAATGCLLGLAISYGENMLWSLTRIRAPTYVAFSDLDLDCGTEDEEIIQCNFMGLTFDVPAAIAKNVTVQRGAMQSLEFTDGTRRVLIVLSSYSVGKAFFGSPPGALSSQTTAQLLQKIYSTDTRDFSLGMRKETFEIHKWSMKYRDALAYETMGELSFDERDGIHVTVLSSGLYPDTLSQEIKRLIAWAQTDNSDGGLIYVFDAEDADGSWGNRIAASLRISPERRRAVDIWLATATDAEILAELNFNSRSDEPSEHLRLDQP